MLFHYYGLRQHQPDTGLNPFINTVPNIAPVMIIYSCTAIKSRSPADLSSLLMTVDLAMRAGNRAIFAQQVWADDYFNPALLDIDNPQQGKTDLVSFMKKVPGQAPGKYQVAVFINNNKIDTRDVTFIRSKDPQGTGAIRFSPVLHWTN